MDRGSARLGPVPIGLDNATGHTLRVRLVGQVGPDATVAPEFVPTAGGTSRRLRRRRLADIPVDATGVPSASTSQCRAGGPREPAADRLGG